MFTAWILTWKDESSADPDRNKISVAPVKDGITKPPHVKLICPSIAHASFLQLAQPGEMLLLHTPWSTATGLKAAP